MFRSYQIVLMVLLGTVVITALYWFQRERPALVVQPLTNPASVSEVTAEELAFESEGGVAQAHMQRSLWTEVESVDESGLNVREVGDRRFVRLDRDQIENIRAGDTIELQIPHREQPVSIEISEVKQLVSGNTSLVGKVDGEPLLDFVMTYSTKATLATIGTDTGVYNLRGDTRHAWIAPGRSYNSHVDPSVPDFRILEIKVPQAIDQT